MSNKYVYTDVKFYTNPDPKGFWILDPGGECTTSIAIYSKPTYAQIKKTQELLGWKWQDAL